MVEQAQRGMNELSQSGGLLSLQSLLGEERLREEEKVVVLLLR